MNLLPTKFIEISLVHFKKVTVIQTGVEKDETPVFARIHE